MTNEIKLNQVKITDFDRQVSKYCTDWVTRYEYISSENLTITQYEKILQEYNVTGEIKFIKKVLRFSNVFQNKTI